MKCECQIRIPAIFQPGFQPARFILVAYGDGLASMVTIPGPGEGPGNFPTSHPRKLVEHIFVRVGLIMSSDLFERTSLVKETKKQYCRDHYIRYLGGVSDLMHILFFSGISLIIN